MSHLWSGRFGDSIDQDVFEFQASFSFDRRLFEDDILGSLAWAEALEMAGVLSSEDTRAINKALTEILDLGRQDPSFVGGSDEDIHAFVERQLVERIGEAGKRLHTGRSRNDQVSLDLRLYLRRRIPKLQMAITELVAALVNQATSAGVTLMPAYTHLRRAQPILVSHFFLAHVAALQRDYARFDYALKEADVLPLGSGAVAGTSYLIDMEALRSRLGFSRVVANSVDAAADRDFVASYIYACAICMMHLSRFSEDLIVFTSEEFWFFELADGVTTGSSLMPQKKNPDPLELVRGKSGRVIGNLTGWLATMKGLPSGYNKDLQEDKEAMFDTEATVLGSLRVITAVVSTLTLNVARAELAAAGLLLATDVADYLVSRGMSFRRAHEVVGGMVRRLIAEGRDFSSLTSEEWCEYSELFGDGSTLIITPRASVEAKRTPQSTNPTAVGAVLDETRDWLEARS